MSAVTKLACAALCAATFAVLPAHAQSAAPLTVATDPPGSTAELPDAAPVDGTLDPEFGVSGAFAVGLHHLANRSALNEELERFGRGSLDSPVADIGGRLSFHVRGFEVSLTGSKLLQGGTDALDTSYDGFSTYVDVGSDVLHERFLTFAPFLGTGWVHGGVCVHGEPGDTSSPDDPLFRQILANPGHESCLVSDSVMVRGGLAMGLVTEGSMNPFGAALFINLRPTFSWAVKTEGYALRDTELPAFNGPRSPFPTIGFFVEAGLLFGTGAR